MPAPTPAAPLDPKAEPTTKTYTVAPRREVAHDGDSGRVAPRILVAGDTLELPILDGVRLQDLGFLVRDDGSSAVPTGGPATSNGVEIKEA